MKLDRLYVDVGVGRMRKGGFEYYSGQLLSCFLKIIFSSGPNLKWLASDERTVGQLTQFLQFISFSYLL